jgi:hypothetical protein
MVIIFESPEVPHVVVQVAVYVPAVTSLVEPVPPTDHVIVPPSQPVAVNIAFSVPHIVVLLADITGADGVAPVLIVTLFELPEVPHVVVQVAV